MPLILPSQRVIRPNPLAYPAGAVPGVDRSHPAAENLILSAVASAGPNYIDVRTGAPLTNQQGAQTSAPSASIVGPLGPAVTSLSGGKALGIAFDSGRTIAAITTAAIFKFASVHQGSGYQTLIVFGGSRGMWTVNDTVTLYLGTDTISATLDFDAPHFIAASAIVNGASSPICLVLRNLKTGQTFTTITTHGNAAFSGLSNLTVGNDTSNEFSTYPVAAAMCSNVFLSPAQLLQWAQDPWSFWYPRSTIQYRTPATTTSGGARIRQRWNRSPLAYPAGATPGFDPAHVASKGLVASCYPAGNTALNLFGTAGFHKPVAAAVTPAAAGIDRLGPVTVLGTVLVGGQGIAFNRPPIGSIGIGQGFTYGAIVRMTSTNANNNCPFQSSANGEGFYHTILGSDNCFGARLFATADLTSGIVPIIGVPYFYAMSIRNRDGTIWDHNHVIVRLDTGQTTAVVGAGVSLGAVTYVSVDQFTYAGLSTDISNGSFTGNIAATMFNTNPLNIAQLVKWGKSPWEFWYPNETINLASAAASAGASFLPVWAYRYNLPVLGTGNF